MPPRKPESLTAADWTRAALDALARGGLAAVSVEPLAKQLGTTKGSFYWHFADRNALIAAALALWETRDTDLVIAAVEQQGDAAARLRDLLRIAFTAAGGDTAPGTGAVELALQASAGHPLVAATLTRVTERRKAFLPELFMELALPRARARDRGLLAYTAFLGHAQVAHATPELVPRGRAFTRHVGHVVDTLIRIEDGG